MQCKLGFKKEQLTRASIILGAVLIIAGCAALPVPLVYLSTAKSGIDAVQMFRGEQTINDHIISGLTGKTCKTSDWLGGKDLCKEIYKPAPVTVIKLPPL
jgi:hypothetical protein